MHWESILAHEDSGRCHAEGPEVVCLWEGTYDTLVLGKPPCV